MKKKNKERRKLIVEAMLAAGATNREIAAAIGVNDPSGVSHYIRKHNVNVAKKRRGWTDAELTLLRELWGSEATMDEIENVFSYKNIKNLRQAMSRMMYIMRMRGITNARRTVNGVRK